MIIYYQKRLRIYLKNIRCNVVSAGLVKTVSSRVIPGSETLINQIQDRVGSQKLTTKQIGDVVGFLLSDASDCINGQVIYADHGAHLL